MKPDSRQHRDYRFSPATLHLIGQGKQITDKTETAFVEAATQRHHEILVGGDDVGEVERLLARVQKLERELAWNIERRRAGSSKCKQVYIVL